MSGKDPRVSQNLSEEAIGGNSHCPIYLIRRVGLKTRQRRQKGEKDRGRAATQSLTFSCSYREEISAGVQGGCSEFRVQATAGGFRSCSPECVVRQTAEGHTTNWSVRRR